MAPSRASGRDGEKEFVVALERREERERARRVDKWKAAVSGAISGAVSRTLVNPLDVIKIRFQIQREGTVKMAKTARGKYVGVTQALGCIVREEGVRGLWKGTVPGLLLTVPYCAVQFLALETFRSAFQRRRIGVEGDNREVLSMDRTMSFAGGAFAGVAATAASYPFDLLRTTMAAQGVPKQYPTVFHAARGIVAQRGVFRGLYAGLGATVVEIIPYAALQFGLYDIFTAAYDRHVHAAVGSPSEGGTGKKVAVDWSYLVSKPFVCGLASGFIAKFATHPLDVVKKRYQVAGLKRSATYGKGFGVKEVAVLGIFRLLTKTVREEGLQGIYKGVTPSLLKAAPSAAITFAMYSLAMDYMSSAAQG
ncbi:mitochondrial substrate carrier protein [Chloropicon primus]|nr:mitochondrial substrate carrier protein [Chloropicon primus]